MRAARMPVAVIAGFAGAAIAAAGVVGAAELARPSAPPSAAWTPSPAPAELAAVAPRIWDRESEASLTLLRNATANEARVSVRGLVRCERRSGETGATATRVARYRRCALRTLARTGASGATNSRMLMHLLEDATPTPRCGILVRTLAGGAGILGSLARSALRDGVGAPWAQVSEASRSIRRLAHAALRLARRPEWGRACRAQAPAPAPAQAL